jgi:hypothetical protein
LLTVTFSNKARNLGELIPCILLEQGNGNLILDIDRKILYRQLKESGGAGEPLVRGLIKI